MHVVVVVTGGDVVVVGCSVAAVVVVVVAGAGARGTVFGTLVGIDACVGTGVGTFT
jgi:hypothetical protein